MAVRGSKTTVRRLCNFPDDGSSPPGENHLMITHQRAARGHILVIMGAWKHSFPSRTRQLSM